ncbi:hypothetical protein BDR04DRAFT_156303 [Suillus decipiens]|nr:hypothetical protein BDR04DRAFT_156303 [Suillus decipiens]
MRIWTNSIIYHRSPNKQKFLAVYHIPRESTHTFHTVHIPNDWPWQTIQLSYQTTLQPGHTRYRRKTCPRHCTWFYGRYVLHACMTQTSIRACPPALPVYELNPVSGCGTYRETEEDMFGPGYKVFSCVSSCQPLPAQCSIYALHTMQTHAVKL